jgi:Tol biopolymer transport system component
MLGPHLWRVDVDGRGPPERIELAGSGAIRPSIPRTGDRLTFTRVFDDRDIYRVEPARSPEPVARSSLSESNVQFSWDGQRIAFCSDRASDSAEIWVANADGSAPEQLTHGPGLIQCSPSWSPDGGHVAFDSEASDGSWHIWTVDREGGSVHQVTRDPGDQNHPTWSRDGQWIYFAWRQPGEPDVWRRDIWRARPLTGLKERVTESGQAALARESVDGTTLFYRNTMPDGPLLVKPLPAGPIRTLIPCVAGTAVSVTRAGIYYLPCQATRVTTPVVHLVDPATGTDREAGTLENYSYQPTPGAFTVSLDGRVILYERQMRSGSNLMMIENFR